MSRVFVSYSSRDRDRCAEIVDSIEREGIRCWVAPRDISPGALWMDSVTEAIDECSAVLLLVTAHSNGSNQVRRELERAVSRSKDIVPLILEEVQFTKWMQYSISIHHWHSTQCSNLSRDLKGVISSLKQIVPQSMAVPDVTSEISSDSGIGLPGFHVRQSEGLNCSYQFTAGAVPEKLLLETNRDITDLLRVISVKYGLVQRYTEMKSEFSFSLNGDSASDNWLARVLSAALETISMFEKLSERASLSTYGFSYTVTACPEDKHKKSVTDHFSTGESAAAWLESKSISLGSSSEEALTLLGAFVNGSETILSECDLVGRSDEVLTLTALVERQQYWHVENPRGYATHLVAGICGEPGIGKTALVDHMSKDLSSSDLHLVVRGTGDIWLNVLTGLIGVENSEGITGDVIASSFSESFGIEPDEVDREALALFCSREDLSSDADQPGSSVSVQVAFRNLFSSLGETADLVFILEDIHNASSFSLEVLRFLIANSESNRPFVFILTYRPEISGESVFLDIPEGYFLHESFHLNGLAARARTEYCQRLLQSVQVDADCSEKLFRFIDDRAGGNPLFIRELLENLLQKKAVGVVNGEWTLTVDPRTVGFPANLHQVYNSRFQSADAGKRSMLMCLSVLGERFPLRLMYKFLDRISLKSNSKGMGVLESLDGFLKVETSAFRKTVLFAHALLREHLYGSLVDTQLKALHEAAAETLTVFQGSDPGEVAEHWYSAGNLECAIEWGEKKLRLLRGIHDNKGVIYWADRLLKWLPETGGFSNVEYSLRKSRYVCLSSSSDKAAREEELKRLQALAAEQNDMSIDLEVDLLTVSYLTDVGEMSEARSLLEKIEPLLPEENRKQLFSFFDAASRFYQLDYQIEESKEYCAKALKQAETPVEQIKVQQRLATLIDGQGDHVSARNLLEKALSTSRKIHSPVQEVSVLNAVAKSFFDTGDWKLAEENWDRAVNLARKIGRRRSEALMLNMMGHMLSKTKTLDDSLQMQMKALEVMKESGDQHGLALVYTDLGILYSRMGKKELALGNLSKSLEISRKTGNRGGVASALANISSLQKDLGDFELAEKNIREAIDIWRETGFRKREASCVGNLGSIFERNGKMDEALACFKEAIAIGEEIGDKEGNSLRYGNLAVMLHIKKELEDSEQYYNKAISMSREMGNARMVGAWLGYRSALLDNMKRKEEALEGFQESISILKECGDRKFLLQIMGNYSALLSQLGRHEESYTMILEKLELSRNVGYVVDEASSLCSLGHYHRKREEYAEAFDCFRKACLIASEKKLGIHMFRGMMPLYRVLRQNGYEQVDEYFPKHWGVPDEITRDGHMPEEKGF